MAVAHRAGILPAWTRSHGPPVRWDVGTGAVILKGNDRAHEEYGDSETGRDGSLARSPMEVGRSRIAFRLRSRAMRAMPFHGGICSRSESCPPRGLTPRLWRELDGGGGRLERDAPDFESADRAFRSVVDDGRLWRSAVSYSPPGGFLLVVHGEEHSL